MYCAYPVPGMGSNSLMYYYNGKSVSSLSGNVCVSETEGSCIKCGYLCVYVYECIPLTVSLILCEVFALNWFQLLKHFVRLLACKCKRPMLLCLIFLCIS